MATFIVASKCKANKFHISFLKTFFPNQKTHN
jgi:hypothetical protein